MRAELERGVLVGLRRRQAAGRVRVTVSRCVSTLRYLNTERARLDRALRVSRGHNRLRDAVAIAGGRDWCW
jgi:hypothetical protein